MFSMADPFSPFEIRKLTAAHSGYPQCLTCFEPQRCIIGRLLDTLYVHADIERHEEKRPDVDAELPF